MIIEPGKVSQYGSTLAAGAAGVAGAAGLSGIGISTAKATSKNEIYFFNIFEISKRMMLKISSLK